MHGSFNLDESHTRWVYQLAMTIITFHNKPPQKPLGSSRKHRFLPLSSAVMWGLADLVWAPPGLAPDQACSVCLSFFWPSLLDAGDWVGPLLP